MNRAKKNIVIVGFTKEENKNISIPYLENNTVRYLDSIKEAIKYQGYLLIINNKDAMSIVDLDKKYRKSFQKYEMVRIYNEKYDWKKEKWSNVYKVNRDIFEDASFSMTEDWEEYKHKKENEKQLIRYNSDKQKKLDELYKYLKKFKTIKTKQIVADLKISARSIERYMMDLNNLYHNIGYDYTRNEWYFIW